MNELIYHHVKPALQMQFLAKVLNKTVQGSWCSNRENSQPVSGCNTSSKSETPLSKKLEFLLSEDAYVFKSSKLIKRQIPFEFINPDHAGHFLPISSLKLLAVLLTVNYMKSS